MPENIWTGSTSGDASVVTNWSLGHIPINDEDVSFYSTATRNITSGLTALAAVTADKVIVGSGQNFDMGTSSNYFELGCNDLIMSGNGKVYFDVKSSSPFVKTHSTSTQGGLWIKSDTTELLCFGKGNTYLTDGTHSEVIVEHTDAILKCESASTPTITTLYVTNGLLKCETGATGVIIGEARVSGSGLLQLDDGELADLYQHGGNVVWNCEEDGNVFRIYAGTFNASGDQRYKGITYLEMHYPSTVNLKNGANSISFTYPIIYKGGNLLMDPDASYSFA